MMVLTDSQTDSVNYSLGFRSTHKQNLKAIIVTMIVKMLRIVTIQCHMF